MAGYYGGPSTSYSQPAAFAGLAHVSQGIGARYRAPGQARQVEMAVQLALSTYPDLRPQFGLYSYENGRQSDILFLTGTIPIVFRGSQYNIPICIWLPDTYPAGPPLCYVAPTPEMAVKPGKHVDSGGKVYLPYLHTWTQASTLVDLVSFMCGVFGEEPPVYARSAGSQPPPQQQPQPQQPPRSQSYSSQPATPVTPASPPQTKPDEISTDIIRQSLESYVTAKLQTDLRALFDTRSAVMREHLAHKQQLQAGEVELRDILARLDDSTTKATETLTVLETKNSEVQESIASLEASGEVDIDTAVVTTTPLYKQLMELVADDNAIEDTIYHLGKALELGTLELPVYLKHLRQLSRKQFTVRALIRTARQQAQLV